MPPTLNENVDFYNINMWPFPDRSYSSEQEESKGTMKAAAGLLQKRSWAAVSTLAAHILVQVMYRVARSISSFFL